MSTESSETGMSAWRAFLDTHATVIGALERELDEEVGLPIGWYDVLTNLSDAPEGRLRMQQLAESVVLSRSGLTRLVDRMERGGLVTREMCPIDRRGTYAVITPEGGAALQRAAPTHRRGIQQHFLRHMSSEDLRALRRALEKVLRAEKGSSDVSVGAPSPLRQAQGRL